MEIGYCARPFVRAPRNSIRAPRNFVTAELTQDQEHEQFVLERRQETFAQFLADIEELRLQIEDFANAQSEVAAKGLLTDLDRVEVSYNQILLIAGQGIRDEARTVADDLKGGVRAQLDPYCAADDSPAAVCNTAPDGDRESMSAYEKHKESLLVSMKSELRVPP